MKLFSFSVRAGSTACHARLFPLEGAGSSGRAGRAARSIFLLLLHRGAAIPAGTPLVTLGTHWGCPCPHRQFHTNGGSGQSTRGLNGLRQNHIWFQLIGNRKTEGKAQRTNTCMCTHTLFSHLPAQPCSTGSGQLFWALWVMMLKPALQVLLFLLFQPSPGLLQAAGLSFCSPALTCGCLTCFQWLQRSLYTGRTLDGTSEPAFLIPYRSRYNWLLVGDPASQAEIHLLERRRSPWEERTVPQLRWPRAM